MSRRSIAIATALSVLALGSPLVGGNANPLATQYFDQGVEKHEAGNYQGAIDDWSRAIAINPKNALAYYNRGLAKYDLQDYQGAIADYTKAIDINPQYAIAYGNRGNSKIKLGDYQGAVADYDKVIEIKPRMSLSIIIVEWQRINQEIIKAQLLTTRRQ